MRDRIVITVYDNGINVQRLTATLGFYRDWAEYFRSLSDWRPGVAVCVRRDYCIFLPR